MSDEISKDIYLKEYHELLSFWKSQPYELTASPTEINHSIPLYLTTFLNHFPCVTSIFHLPTQQFAYVSNNSKEVLGYDTLLFQEGGIDFWNKILHPEDRKTTWKLLKRIWKSIARIPQSEWKLCKFNYDYRIIKPGGRETRILGQYTIYQQDNHGCITYILGIHSDISSWKRNGEQVASIFSPTQNTLLVFGASESNYNDQQTILSKREVQILQYLAKGYSSKLIADELNISVHTVNTHRQHMLCKTNTKTTGELINYYITYK